MAWTSKHVRNLTYFGDTKADGAIAEYIVSPEHRKFGAVTVQAEARNIHGLLEIVTNALNMQRPDKPERIRERREPDAGIFGLGKRKRG